MRQNHRGDNPVSLAALSLVALVAALCIRCSMDLVGGGTTTETTNGYAIGVLKTGTGKPATNTRVTLLPATHNPMTDPAVSGAMTDTTDDAGRYKLSTPHAGSYVIEAENTATKEMVLMTGVAIVPGDTTPITAAALQETGVIRILFPYAVYDSSAYVYLPGTTRFARVTHDTVLIESVPAGTIPSVNYASMQDLLQNRVIRSDLAVLPADTALVTDLAQARFSRRLFLNTTQSGAGIASNVVGFPVVIRLDSDNFNFSEAAGDGRDLRFTKSNGTILSYEIECWDAAMQRAAIWVKLDTVYGNDDTQFLIMSWGDSLATPLSNGAAVFDTSRGFQGVWHMTGSSPENVKDATQNRFDGETHLTIAAPGMIGSARQFDGQTSFVQMTGTSGGSVNFESFGTFTVSAWAYVAAMDTVAQFIAGKGERQYGLLVQEASDTTIRYAFRNYLEGPDRDVTRAPAAVGVWAFIAGVREGNRQAIYVNGMPVSDSIIIIENARPKDAGQDFSIGNCLGASGGDRYFDGLIDEVRISSRALSPDWIKLCYMNQKAADALVRFE